MPPLLLPMGQVFPARAGMSPAEEEDEPVGERVPRASGDEPAEVLRYARDLGCSPRERG